MAPPAPPSSEALQNFPQYLFYDVKQFRALFLCFHDIQCSMTIDFKVIAIVLINKQVFVWVFESFLFLELLDRFKDFIVWRLLMCK